MKSKDLALVIICALAIIVSGYFMFGMFFPKSSSNTVNKNTNTQQTQVNNLTGNPDQDVIKKVDSFTDYGEGQLDNIGRVNPFGPIN